VPTTTIRVDCETHAQLVALSDQTDQSLLQTVRDAANALQRVRFGLRVQTELDLLREDTSAWDSYVAEADATSVADGFRS
jgi:hypothetical protein